MQKLVTLQFDGDLTTQGFQVSLAVGPEHQRPEVEIQGKLPPSLQLAEQLDQWQQLYRRLGHIKRIKPQQIVYIGAINLVEDCRQAALRLAHTLSDWLTAPDFSAVDRRLREALNRNDQARILIRSNNPQLHQLPWHLWDLVDRYPHTEVAMTAVSFEQVPAVPRPHPHPQVKVLAIVGHSAGLDTDVDRRLLAALPNAEVTLLVEPQRQQFNDQLWAQPWDILFFAGHSQTKARQGHLSINPNDTLTLEELQYGLRRAIAQGLQLAIFNSCDGLGLAYALEQLQLPQMIVMREPLPDPVAHAFLQYFLDAFSQGTPLYLATRQARERLQGLEGEFPCASWLPVIFQHPAVAPPDWQDLLGQPDDTRPSLPSGKTLIKPRWRRRSQVAIALISTAIAGLTLGLREFGGLRGPEHWAYDTLLQWRPTERPDDRLLIITIDDGDIRFQEEQGMALQNSLAPAAWQQLTAKLTALQPHSVGVDIYRSTPLQTRKRAGDVPIFGICKVPAPTAGDPDGVDPPPNHSTDYVGFSDFVVDRDDILRRHLLALRPPNLNSKCTARNAFNLLLALHYLETKGQKRYALTANQEFQFGDVVWRRLSTNAGGYQGIDANGYQMLLNYRRLRDAQTIAPTLRLRDLLTDQVPPTTLTQLQGRIVLVGVTAPSSRDDWRTPLSHTKAVAHRKIPGILVQAQMLSQLLSSVIDGRPLLWWWPPWAEVLWIVGWAFVGGFGMGHIVQTPRRLGFAIATILLLLGLCYILLLQAGWIPLLPAALALVASQAAVAKWQQHSSSERFTVEDTHAMP